MYKTRLRPSRRLGPGPAEPHVPACRAPQTAAARRRPAAEHAGTRSAQQHPHSSRCVHMDPHLISSAVYIPKDTPTSRRHGTTLGGLMANEQLFPGRQLIPLSPWKRRATGSTTRSKARGGRGRAVPPPRTGGTGLPPAGGVVRSPFPEASAREQHGGAAGWGRLLAAGAVAGPALPPPGRAGEPPVRVRRGGRAGWRRRHRGGIDGRGARGVGSEAGKAAQARWLVGLAWSRRRGRRELIFWGSSLLLDAFTGDLPWFWTVRSLPGRDFERLSDS